MISQTKIKSRARKKENPELKLLVDTLRKKGSFWQEVSVMLVRSKRQSIKVNLAKLEKETKDGDVIVVPGKILGSGIINHKLTLGALSYSLSVKDKMKKVKILSLDKMAEDYKNGKGVKIIA